MGVREVANEMSVDDLPGQLPVMAEVIGMELTLAIWLRFSGHGLRFPSKLPSAFCARYIRNNYNGSNAFKIANDLGIGDRTFRNLLNKKGHFGQTDLFKANSQS